MYGEILDFDNLPWAETAREDDDGSVVDESYLREHSSTYKILHGTLQKVFSSDSDSDKERKSKTKDEANQGNSPGKKKNPTSRYVPCYFDETKIKFTTFSTLSADQQAKYLMLLKKMSQQHSPYMSPCDQNEVIQYEMLHEKVVKERYDFTQFVKKTCARNKDRYLLISPDVKRYIEELWTHKLCEVKRYPACYEPLRMLPLVYADNKKTVLFKLEEHLLELGSLALVLVPQQAKTMRMQRDYAWMSMHSPPDGKDPNDPEKNLHKVAVSEDKNAEVLAVRHDADIVISASAMKTIVDNHPPSFERSWDIPIVVRECTDPGSGKKRKVVFVDKPLPPKDLTNMEKNLWFYKRSVKAMVCLHNHPGSMRLGEPPPDEATFMEDMMVNSEVSEMSETESEKLKAIPRNVSPWNPDSSSDVSQRSLDEDHGDSDSDSKLVIDCSDTERTPVKKVKTQKEAKIKPANSEMTSGNRVTRSMAKLIEKLSGVNRSLGHKPIRLLDKSAVDKTKPCVNEDKHKKKERKASVPQPRDERPSGWNSPPTGRNVSYKLWKLFREESNMDHHASFLKGDDNVNLELKVIVRCQLDGFQLEKRTMVPLVVATKLEYQTEFGAECLTQSEITQQLMSLYLRPSTSLLRVRVNASTAEVLMVQRRSMQELVSESAQHLHRKSSVVLGTLYNVLGGLVDLEPGKYLLSHYPNLGAFVNLRQHQGKGRINLYDMYSFDPKSMPSNDKFVWNPIDHSVITPYHREYNRVPGTFPPTLIINGKCVSKNRAKKKKKKKKQMAAKK